MFNPYLPAILAANEASNAQGIAQPTVVASALPDGSTDSHLSRIAPNPIALQND
jgi:hypothetical protein